MPRTILSHGKRRRRVPAWTSVALILLLASTSSSSTHPACSSVQAFVLPKQRVRIQPSTMAVRSSEEKKKASLEFGDQGEEEGKQDRIIPRNGKEIQSKIPPGSPLSMISEEANNNNNNNIDANDEEPFEIHVGRALDTLKKDYPHMLTDQPDFSIFDSEIEVIDPSGVKLHGLKNYKSAFRLMHGIVAVFYCPERSGLTFRMCYDTARQSIRVSWNAEVIPKAIFGGIRTALHVDGISVYEISRGSGKITQHRIERLIMNDSSFKPKEGIFALLRNEHDENVPVFTSFITSGAEDPVPNNSGVPSLGNAFEFRCQKESLLFGDNHDNDKGPSSTALAATDNNDASTDSSSSSSEDYPGLDWEAYERKNQSRKKFGLDPLTPEEFLENEAIVKQMDLQQRQRAASASAAAEMTKQRKTRQQGFLERLFGDIIPEACESNFDCVRPELCCDFGFKKICCASGTPVGSQQLEPGYVRVPVDIYPREGQEPRGRY